MNNWLLTSDTAINLSVITHIYFNRGDSKVVAVCIGGEKIELSIADGRRLIDHLRANSTQ
jgi:hypothetical protein